MAGAKPYSEEQIIALLECRAMIFYAGEAARNRALFAVGLSTGCRVSELVSIRIGDVVDRFGQIRTDLRIWQEKTDSYRVIPVANPLFFRFVPPWLKQLARRGYILEDHPLFPGQGGTAICTRTVNRIYAAMHHELRMVGYSSHSTRKTWACQVYTEITAMNRTSRLAVDPFEKLCDLGGWQSYDAARRYISDAVDCRREIQQAIYPAVRRHLRRVSQT